MTRNIKDDQSPDVQMSQITRTAGESIKKIFDSAFESTLRQLKELADSLPTDMRQELQRGINSITDASVFKDIKGILESISTTTNTNTTTINDIKNLSLTVAQDCSADRVNGYINTIRDEFGNLEKRLEGHAKDKMDLFGGELGKVKENLFAQAEETQRTIRRQSLIMLCGYGVIIVLILIFQLLPALQ